MEPQKPVVASDEMLHRRRFRHRHYVWALFERLVAEVAFRSRQVALGSGFFLNYGMVSETFLEVWNVEQEACLSTSSIVAFAPHGYKTKAYDASLDTRRTKPLLDEEFRAHDPPTLALAEDLWVLTKAGTVNRILANTPLRGAPPSR